MELVVNTQGIVIALHGEEIDLASLGSVSIRRASHVEPDALGRWWVDLSPIGGPSLGPFAWRSLALRAEQQWIIAGLRGTGDSPRPASSSEWPCPLAKKRAPNERIVMKQLRGMLSRIARAMARATLVTVGVLMQLGTFLLLITGCSSNGKQKKSDPEKPKAEIKWHSAESPYKGRTVVHEDGSRDEHTEPR